MAQSQVNSGAKGAVGNPTLKLTPGVRLIIYVVTAVLSIVVAYCNAKGWAWLGDPELSAWSSIVALVNGLAAINVSLKSK